MCAVLFNENILSDIMPGFQLSPLISDVPSTFKHSIIISERFLSFIFLFFLIVAVFIVLLLSFFGLFVLRQGL
ncbi:hypothetical protein ACRRTK_018843 [Alexandromys fortis]